MGNERLFPAGEVDVIPQWVFDLVVRPIVAAGIISGDDYINSAVIEDYQPRGERNMEVRSGSEKLCLYSPFQDAMYLTSILRLYLLGELEDDQIT